MCRFNDINAQDIIINPYEQRDIGIDLYSLYIVRSPSDLNLSYVKKKMKNKEYIRYAIVFTEKITSNSYRNDLSEIFDEFWQRQVLNVIIIFWTSKLNCFTYTPFGERYLIPLNVNWTQPDRLFYEKTRNLEGYTLRLGMFFEPQRASISEVDGKFVMKGIDGGLAQMIINAMNATLQLVRPVDNAKLGEIFSNKTSSGIIALFENETIDMSFNARFYRMQHFRGIIEPTITLGRDDLCILVPRTGISLNLDNIFDAFEMPVWTLVIIALPIYAIFLHIYHGKWRGYRKSYSLSHTFLRLFGWNLNQPYMRSPRTAFIKIMIGLWIMYSAVITNWYNSNLTSYLMVKPRLPDITTLEQLEQSNYHILTLKKYADVMNEFLINLKGHQNLLGRVHAVNEQNGLFNYISDKNTMYAYAHKEHILRFILNKDHLYETFAEMKECAVPFVNVYALSYGSPYKGRVNWLLSQSIDCGITDHWLDIRSHIDKLNQVRHQKSASEQHVAISISHLQSAFYILLFGCIVSFLVFIFEIYQKKNKNLNE